MKIVIKSKDGPKHLSLIFPLGFVKTKLASRIISKNGDININKDELHSMLKEAYKVLKDYIKVNGHFDMVDIRSSDGDIVKIKV